MKTLVPIVTGLLTLSLVAAFSFYAVNRAQAAEPQVQKPTPGKQVEQSTPALNYLLYLPQDYQENSDQKWPVIVFLHGLGERGDQLGDLQRVKMHGPPMLVEKQSDFKFIVVSPQCHTDSWWPWDVDDLNQLLDQVLKDVKGADASRVYLTGLSMGGFGSFTWAIRNPERFAAVAPLCGGGVFLEYLGITSEKVDQLKNLPFWIFHGEADSAVTVEQSKQMEKGLKNFGVKEIKLTLYPGVDHNCWTQTYANPKLYSWFLEHVRK